MSCPEHFRNPVHQVVICGHDQVSNPGSPGYESSALPTRLPAARVADVEHAGLVIGSTWVGNLVMTTYDYLVNGVLKVLGT